MDSFGFKKIPCPICRSKRYKVLYKSTLTSDDLRQEAITENFKNTLSDYTKHGQVVKCEVCKLVYINPIENIRNYIRGYENVIDYEYLKTEKFRKILSLDHLNHIKRFKKSGKLLDVGCFAGFFLGIASKHGFKTFGLEPSKWAAGYAKKNGARIIGKTVEKTRLPKNYFDLITMWDVIEHLSSPDKVIEILHKALKKNGIIAIGTPDVESLMFKILGQHHPYYLRMHLVLFSPKTLKRLLEKKGFKILNTYHYGRTYPLYYLLDLAQTKIPAIKVFNFIKKIKFAKETPITLNLGDEFTVIAQKTG